MGDNVYAYGPPGLDWSQANLERQGAIVDRWHSALRNHRLHIDVA
jgi:hypothetical protein